jgi:hypothetical protein
VSSVIETHADMNPIAANARPAVATETFLTFSSRAVGAGAVARDLRFNRASYERIFVRGLAGRR